MNNYVVICDQFFRLGYCRFDVPAVQDGSVSLNTSMTNDGVLWSSSTQISTNFTLNSDILYLIGKQRQLYAVAVPILLVYTLLVFLLNASILLTVPYVKGKLNLTLRLTVSLTLADLWTTAMVAFSLTHNSYLYYVYGLMTNACLAMTIEVMKLSGFFCSILHLLALAVNHYLSTAHPFLGRKLLTPRMGAVVIATLWLLPTAAVSMGFGLVPGQGYQTPGGTCADHSFTLSFEFRAVILSLICVLLICMSALYVSVLVALARMKRKLSVLRKTSPQRACQQYVNNRKTFVTTLLIWGTFFLGWFPSSLLFVLTCEQCAFSFRNKDHYFTVYAFGVSSNFCILSKTLVNPIIYAVRIPEIKTVLQDWRRRRCQHTVAGANSYAGYSMPPTTSQQQNVNLRTSVPRWSTSVDRYDLVVNRKGENMILLDNCKDTGGYEAV